MLANRLSFEWRHIAVSVWPHRGATACADSSLQQSRTKPRIVHKSSNITCPTKLLQYYLITVRCTERTERTELSKVQFRWADPWIANIFVLAACVFTIFNVERRSANIMTTDPVIMTLKKTNIIEYAFGEGEGVNKKRTLCTL